MRESHGTFRRFPLWHPFTLEVSPPLHTRSWLVLNGRGNTQHKEVTILVCPTSLPSRLEGGDGKPAACLSHTDGQSLVFTGSRWGAETEARCKARVFTGRDVEYRDALCRMRDHWDAELAQWEVQGESRMFSAGDCAGCTWHEVYRSSNAEGTSASWCVQQALQAENPKGEFRAFVRWLELRHRIEVGSSSLPPRPRPTVGEADTRCEVHFVWAGGGGSLQVPAVDAGASGRRPPRPPLLDLQSLCACRVESDLAIDEGKLSMPVRVWAASRAEELGMPRKAMYREEVRRRERLVEAIRAVRAGQEGEESRGKRGSPGGQMTLEEMEFRQVKPRTLGSSPASADHGGQGDPKEGAKCCAH